MRYPHQNRILTTLILPAFLFMVVFLVLPLLYTVADSFLDDDGRISIISYLDFFLDSKSANIYWRTMRIAIKVTLLAVITGYPAAWVISRMTPRWRSIMMMIFMIPLMTNPVARTYAWLIILGRSGPLNRLLLWSGLLDEPLRLMYTENAVVIGLFQILLPLMVLNLISALENISNDVIEAARCLGANGIEAFVRVVVPLSADGLVTGGSLVFTVCIASYTTPHILGGPKVLVLPTLMRQLTTIMNWDGTIVVGVILTLSALFVNLLLRLVRPKTD